MRPIGRNPMIFPFFLSCILYTVSTLAFKVNESLAPRAILEMTNLTASSFGDDQDIFNALLEINQDVKYNSSYTGKILALENEDSKESCSYPPEVLSKTGIIENLVYLQQSSILADQNLNVSLFLALDAFSFMDDPINYISLQDRDIDVKVKDKDGELLKSSHKLGSLWTLSVYDVYIEAYGVDKLKKILDKIDFTSYVKTEKEWTTKLSATGLYSYTAKIKKEICKMLHDYKDDTVSEKYLEKAVRYMSLLYGQTFVQTMGFAIHVQRERRRVRY